MNKVIIKVTKADYYDAVQIFIDGVPYGRKTGNSTFEIPVAPGRHVLHGVYDNNEPAYRGLSHALGPIEFQADGKDVAFTVKISSIYSGGKLVQD